MPFKILTIQLLRGSTLNPQEKRTVLAKVDMEKKSDEETYKSLKTEKYIG